MLFVCLGPKAIFLNSLHSPVFQLLISTPLWVTVSHSYSKQPCIYFLTSDKEKMLNYLLCMLETFEAEEAKKSLTNQPCYFELPMVVYSKEDMKVVSVREMQPFCKVQGFSDPVLRSSAQSCQELS